MGDIIRTGGADVPSELVQQLGQIDILARLSPGDLAGIAEFAEIRHYEPGKAIIEFADESRFVFFLMSGTARVNNYTLTAAPVTLRLLLPGAYFGELSAIDGGPRSARVEAETACRVVAIPPDVFIQLLSAHPTVLGQVLRNMAAMIRASNLTVLDHATL
jgi:CRP-like cAMP-binding protein